MALATLDINLVARLAELQQGFDKASRLSEKAANQIERNFASQQLAAKALGAAIGGAFSVTAIATFVRSTVNGLDALNDLKDATGASIENISALEDVAARTGTSFESMSAALVKFNKVLIDSKPGSEAANTLKALGLSAEELKRIDPAEALRRTAVALSGFADDGNKARIVASLFGKSVQEVAPFLKDLAEQGKLNATVTTAQAQAAEDFNKQLFNLQKNLSDTGRSIVSELAPALNQLFDAIRGGPAGGESPISEFISVPLQAVSVLGANVAFVLKAIGTEIGGIAAQAVAVAQLDFGAAGTIGETMRADAKAAREEFDRLEKRLLGIGKAFPQASYSNEGRIGAKPSVGDVPNAEKAAKDRGLSAEKIAQLQAEAEEQSAKDSAEAWQFYDQMILRDHKETTEASALMWKQWLETIDMDEKQKIEEGQAYMEVKLEKMSEFAKEAAANIQDALGDTLKRAMKGDFDSIADLWKNMLIDMVAQAAATKLNNALFGESFGKTGNFGGILGSIFSGVSTGGAGSGAAVGGDGAFLGSFGDLATPASASSGGTLGMKRISGAPLFDYSGMTINVGDGLSRGEAQAGFQVAIQQSEERMIRRLRNAGVV